MLDPYILVLAGFGALVLLTAWLPMVLSAAPLSLPIVCVGIGALLWVVPEVPGVAPDPTDYPALAERLTEFVVIISLMGAGLKIDRAIGWRSWLLTWRLLGIAMPLTIIGLAVLAHVLLGFGWATAVLLAAALAPTDPVLASDVQVGPPLSGEEDETRFALTSEAGLNDGLAFPFVLLAVALASTPSDEGWLWSWLGYAVLWKVGAGIAVGAAIGWALGWLVFHIPNRAKLSRTGDGFVALGITCLAYGVAEIVGGYGFLAVFVAALALRAAERNSAYHETLHDFAEQLERLLMMALLVIFGGALTKGGLLDALTWEGVLFGLLAVFVVRPGSGLIGLAGAGVPADERGVIAFYGIRGLGSVYYLAYGLQKAEFESPEAAWSTLAFVVLVSVLLHGATVTPVMRYLDRRRGLGEEQLTRPIDDAPDMPLGGTAVSSPCRAPARAG
jgi:NhaP-type Na+/H+ or K+/H+ antiporter